MPLSNDAGVYTYENGIKLHLDDLTNIQLTRYKSAQRNIHEPMEESWFERVFADHKREEFRFIDIGAAVGYYSILVKRRFPRAIICAVEPISEFRTRIRANLKLNGFDPDSIKIFPWAVYPNRTHIELALHHFGSFVVKEDSKKQEDTLLVEARGLKETLAEYPGVIDLAKVDIQSAELPVFEEAIDVLSQNKVHNWIIGTHGLNIHQKILSMFSKTHDILFQDPSPVDQPDGIVVARAKTCQ